MGYDRRSNLNKRKGSLEMTVQQNTKKETLIKMQSEVTGEGAPLVLVPGGLTGWLTWEPHAKRLASTRKVIRVQLISVEYGLRKRKLPSDYSLKTESMALEATLNEIGLTEVVDLVAWSYGAAIALDYALDHPEKVRTLTLIEPPAFWVFGEQKPSGKEYESFADLERTIREDVSEEQLEQFACAVGLCPPGKSPREMPQWQLWMQHRQSLLNTSAPFRHIDNPERLHAFKTPVLLVKGIGSAKFLHQIIDELARQLPNAHVEEMPAGHAPHIVSIDRFLENLAMFQRQVRKV
ncbi:2-hydroxy-6-oxo-2,4-heptadienoate hydrolase [Methanosarcinales archaeon]|nr:2-hydroxy-6-oxo-2,4-heptadienoate hydrolase [Methanosarcinales archaeon]